MLQELTNQVLQTEDRWTAEIEKQRQGFENEVCLRVEMRPILII